MSGEPAGILAQESPLYTLLAEEVFGGAFGLRLRRPQFEERPLDARGLVYGYRERTTGIRVVAKFCARKLPMRGDAPYAAGGLMEREFGNLQRVRALGLDRYPFRAVRPLAASSGIEDVLVVEHAPGLALAAYLDETPRGASTAVAQTAIVRVATFLAALHGRSRVEIPAVDGPPLAYLERVTGHLLSLEVISEEQRGRLATLGREWASSGLLRTGDRVLIHGDANPTHFWLSDDGAVTMIDAERVAVGDRAADLGYLAGDLKSLFWRIMGDQFAGEPYVRYLYAAYAALCPEVDFEELTLRGQFFMACAELRIARNEWLDVEFRRSLATHAEECLRI